MRRTAALSLLAVTALFGLGVIANEKPTAEFQAVMTSNGATNGALRMHIMAKDYDAIAAQAREFRPADQHGARSSGCTSTVTHLPAMCSSATLSSLPRASAANSGRRETDALCTTGFQRIDRFAAQRDRARDR